MEENNNVTQDTSAEQDDFLSAFEGDSYDNVSYGSDEEDVETGSEQHDETETETAETETDGEAAAEEPVTESYTVRINGEDKQFTIDELKAEAGRSIARQEKLDKVSANTERLAEIARKHNMSVADLIEQTEQSLNAVDFENRRQEYIDKGLDEDVAEMLANKDIEIQQAQLQNKTSEPTAEQIKQQRDIDLLNKLYPDVTADDLTEDIMKDIHENGMSVVEAYQKHMLDKVRQEAEAEKQKAANEKKSVGSARNTKAVMHDDFLTEFMKD